MTNKEAITNLNHIYGIVSSDIQRSLDIAIKAIEERPQGEWVEVEKQGRTGDGRIFTYTIVVCSECGEQYDLEGEKFCPNCGADMRGKEE